MKALRTWMALPVHEKSLVIEAWLDFLLVAALLRTPLHRRLMRAQKLIAQRPNKSMQPDRVIKLVDAAANLHIKKMSCLEQALVAQRILRRRGENVTLRIGVTRLAGDFKAHAWLEQNGQPLDNSAGHFSMMLRPGP